MTKYKIYKSTVVHYDVGGSNKAIQCYEQIGQAISYEIACELVKENYEILGLKDNEDIFIVKEY